MTADPLGGRERARDLHHHLRTVIALVGLLLGWPLTPAHAQHPDSMPHMAMHGMGWGRETFVLTEVLEYTPAASARAALFDIVAWTGGASRRVWFKADGDAAIASGDMHGAYQVLYGQMVSPWWDAQIGARVDVRRGDRQTRSRAGAMLGVQGLAPGWFEVEPSLFVTTDGKVAFDLTASYDVFLTQRLVVQPRLESTAALQDDLPFGIGRGVGETSFGLRTRYEWRREVAPYVGILWERNLGRTGELSRSTGAPTGMRRVVAGLRLWR